MTLRVVGGMVYFLFALVLFAALTNITAMDNDGRMPSLPSMDPGAAAEAGSAATVRPVMFSGLLAATRAAAEISAEYVSQLAREALVENGFTQPVQYMYLVPPVQQNIARQFADERAITFSLSSDNTLHNTLYR